MTDRAKMRYFIPDWDDRVDPGYNFLTEEHTPGRDPYRDDYYAHQIYDTPPYDGVLLSRATLDQNSRKREAILEAGSVHRYLRLPVDGAHQVLGDCGAFSYWAQERPPYNTEEVLAYYQELKFDIGVSVDHLIFAEVEAEKERRWQITIDNAEEFLRLHQREGYTFTPVGVAQGWDPRSYERATRALVQMGYRYIAIGGLVRSRTEDVIRTLVAVKEALHSWMQAHLFGVNRPEHAPTFAALGVTSFDSASRLRRAWMDGRHNYFLGDEAYTAIRIPKASAVTKKRDVDEAEARRLERDALETMRLYDRGQATLEETARATLSYATLANSDRPPVERDYRRTLGAEPWKRCPCRICATIGVEVIVFRGNNRNRRRGFHNTWQLYQHLQQPHEPPTIPAPRATQLELSI